MELIIKLLKIKMDFHYLTNPIQFIPKVLKTSLENFINIKNGNLFIYGDIPAWQS